MALNGCLPSVLNEMLFLAGDFPLALLVNVLVLLVNKVI